MGNDQEYGTMSMVGIGERLKKARENRSLTVDQVQKGTRIHAAVLRALEEGRCGEILTTTYVKSFLKKYADFLGLDSGQILKEYSGMRPETPVQKIKIDRVETERAFQFSKYVRTAITLAIIVSIIAFCAFLGGKVVGFFKSTKAGRVSASGAAQVQPGARKGSELTPKRSLDKINFNPPIPQKTPLELVLKVKQAVLVQLERDDALLFKRVLPKGSVESIKANRSIVIYLAKGESVELTLNGKFLGSLGKGVVKELIITRNGIRIK